MSHRSFRSTLAPLASGFAAVAVASWLAALCGSVPAAAAAAYTGMDAVQAQEWWLTGLHVTHAWQTTEGAGVTVALLGTGVAAAHPDLAGAVTTGPDFTGSGREPGGHFWGIDGTEVAGIIAGHGHGTGRTDGVLGIAPAARILSIRVNLEFNDPLNSNAAIARHLPAAIAQGIIFAVDHGARIIDLPLDPGTAGLSGKGDPAAAGGSQAEQAAVSYAVSRNVLLIAPAGDDGEGPGMVDRPASYPGVIAVGAVGRNGKVAPFSSRRPYVSLAAPGVGLAAAVPPDGYARISSTSTSSGIVAGVAALILSRFPHLTAAQVAQALAGSTAAGSGQAAAPGTGHGIVDAGRAVDLAAAAVAASQPSPSATPKATPRPHGPARLSTTAAHLAGPSTLAGSLVRYVVAGLGALIVLLVGLLLVMRSRRHRADAAESGPARARPGAARGQHEQRRPEPVPLPGGLAGAGGAGRSQLVPRSPSAAAWTAAGGWQGGSVAGTQLSSTAPFPVMAPAPKAPKSAARAAGTPGPPWEPAAEPERTFGPLPVAASSALPPDQGPGIRLPGDMAVLHAVAPDTMLPAPFDVAVSPDPDFPPRPAAGDGSAADVPGLSGLTARQSFGLAAAPIPADYAPPQAPDFTVPSPAAGLVLAAETVLPQPPAPTGPVAGPPRGAADPSYIWDLAATDVFPAAASPAPPAAAPGAAAEDEEPAG